MNEKEATGNKNEEEQTGGDDKDKGSGGNELSRRAFMEEVSNSRIASATPEDGELSSEQQRDIRDATREFIRDVEDDFDEFMPNATRSQKQQFTRAMLDSDPGMILKVVQEAMKTSADKEDQERRRDSEDLHIQGGGSGKDGNDPDRPNSLMGALAQAARGLRGS